MPPLNADILRLTCGSLEAHIAPRAGGSLARFNAGQQALMRPCADENSTDPLTMACYPLLPFIGRIALGHFRFENRDITLPPHPIAVPHALHGIGWQRPWRSEEHTSELQSLMRISYAVFCLTKKTNRQPTSRK